MYPAGGAQVYTELHASPYREHKLHFGTFLRGSAKPLLAAMAAARSAAPDAGVSGGAALTSDAVLATLDSIVDLEFYMPVKEHFVTWTGGRDLIVASALRDDGRVPFGFDLTGQPVALSAFRADAVLKTAELVRLPRLSVMPLTAVHLARIEKLAGG